MPRTHSGQRGRVSVQSRPWRFSAPARDKISPSLQRPQKGEHQRYCTRLLAAAARQACYGLVCCLLCFAWLVLVVSWVRTFPFLLFICHHFLSCSSVSYIYPHRFVPLQYLRPDGLRHCYRRCPRYSSRASSCLQLRYSQVCLKPHTADCLPSESFTRPYYPTKTQTIGRIAGWTSVTIVIDTPS